MRVIVADDALLFREGLCRILAADGFEVVAQVGTAEDLLLRVHAEPPDVAVIDIRMPPSHTTEGLEAALTLRRRHSEIGVVVLSHHVETHYAFELLGTEPAGVGYLLKDRVDDIEGFLAGIRRVANGGAVIDPVVVSRLLDRRRRNDPLGALSPREREVLALMAEGRSNAAIAAALVVAEKTIETHVANLFVKLDLHPEASDNRRVLAVLEHLRALSAGP
jgi:DNA-binding NarL/FixJ family response regulator